MKRELKVVCLYQSLCSWLYNRKAHPDEKGTESLCCFDDLHELRGHRKAHPDEKGTERILTKGGMRAARDLSQGPSR